MVISWPRDIVVRTFAKSASKNALVSVANGVAPIVLRGENADIVLGVVTGVFRGAVPAALANVSEEVAA